MNHRSDTSDSLRAAADRRPGQCTLSDHGAAPQAASGIFHFAATRLSSSKGAAAVEFALICPLLVLLLFAMVEFGLYMFNRQVVVNACREGARAGIVARPTRLSDAQIAQVVDNFSQQHLVTFGAPSTLNVTVFGDPPIPPNPAVPRCLIFQCPLSVQGSYVYRFLYLSTIGIGPVTIQSTARMLME